MDLRIRSKLKALPIWSAADFSPKSVIVDFMTISERSGLIARSLRAALNKLSDAELDEYSEPRTMSSTSQATAFLADKGTQSSEYQWTQHDSCLVLLARSRFAKRLDVPGVVFEFVIRTGRSTWTAYRMPEPREIFGCPVYLDRNELVAHSRRPSRLPMPAVRRRPRRKLIGLGRAVAVALWPSPVRQD